MEITNQDYLDAEKTCQIAFENRFKVKLGRPSNWRINGKDEMIKALKDIIELFLNLKPKELKNSYDCALMFLCSIKIKETVEKIKLINQ